VGVSVGWQVTEVASDKELIVELARGTSGDAEESGELLVAAASIQRQLPRLSSSHISRHLKRLRVHGLIKRIGHRYKYYLTELGAGLSSPASSSASSLCCRNSHRQRPITLFLADT
jgi:hypothetical protein